MRNIPKIGIVPIPTIVFGLALALLTGCVSHKPLSAVPEPQRGNIRVVDVTNARTRQTGYPNGPSAKVSRVIEVLNFPNHTYDWVQTIRHQDGGFECALVETAFQTALGKIHSSTKKIPTSTLELQIKCYGIDQLQPGWYGPYLCAAAVIKDSDGKKIWSAQAASVGTRLRQKADLQNNPELYREDFAEVVEDVAHQLVEGPIRRSYLNNQ